MAFARVCFVAVVAFACPQLGLAGTQAAPQEIDVHLEEGFGATTRHKFGKQASDASRLSSLFDRRAQGDAKFDAVLNEMKNAAAGQS